GHRQAVPGQVRRIDRAADAADRPGKAAPWILRGAVLVFVMRGPTARADGRGEGGGAGLGEPATWSRASLTSARRPAYRCEWALPNDPPSQCADRGRARRPRVSGPAAGIVAAARAGARVSRSLRAARRPHRERAAGGADLVRWRARA